MTLGDGVDGYARKAVVRPAKWFTRTSHGYSHAEAATLTTGTSEPRVGHRLATTDKQNARRANTAGRICVKAPKRTSATKSYMPRPS